MKNRFIAFFIVFSLLMAATGIFTQAEDSGTINLTLEDAQKRALENNLQYKLQDSYISDALESYYDAEVNYNKQSSTASKSFIDYFNKPTTLEVSVQTAANKVRSSRFQKEDIKRNSDYNVLKSFINIKKSQYTLENAKKDAEVKSTQYETAKAKYGLGIINANSLRQSESAYNSAVEAEATALSNLQKEMQTLNRYLGRELTDYNLNPVLNLSEPAIGSIDMDKLRKDYISNKESLYNLQLNVEVAQRKYDLTKERYDEFVNRLKVDNSRAQMEEAFNDSELEYENTRKSFEDATIDLDMSLSTSLSALKSSAAAIAELKADIEAAKAKREIAQLQYDMGLISKTDMDKAVIDSISLENKLKTSIADLNLQYASLMLYSK